MEQIAPFCCTFALQFGSSGHQPAALTEERQKVCK